MTIAADAKVGRTEAELCSDLNHALRPDTDGREALGEWLREHSLLLSTVDRESSRRSTRQSVSPPTSNRRRSTQTLHSSIGSSRSALRRRSQPASPNTTMRSLFERPRYRELPSRRAQRHQLTGRTIEMVDHDLIVRSTSMQRAHHAIPLTTAMCVAAAGRVPGTVAHTMIEAPEGRTVRLAHPKGIATVDVRIRHESPTIGHVMAVSVDRTARQMLSGVAHVDRRPLSPNDAGPPG